MLFNSIDFAIFLPIVFILYWFVFNKNLKLQNIFILVVSYIFYGWWDWRFLFLIIVSTLLDYFVGRKLFTSKDKKTRSALLFLSLFMNLGALFFFKYFNFFQDNFITAFSFFGHNINKSSLNIILPVGISFYTFQTLSYSIDVYKRNIEPTKDIIAFAAFVNFFPQLVAGPIERASSLLPQFLNKRNFDYKKSVDGMRQILWGLFKKIVIADSCAEYANLIFNNSNQYGGSTLLLGALFFTFQIYCDFSGYSDIAIGTSRLFGFNLMRNFSFPYFSRDIAEFWRRWHISLSTWFRDYLYIPLGGSKGNLLTKIRNVFVIFIVSGFWHGANWTYIAWGGVNALCFLPVFLLGKNRKNMNTVAEGKNIPSVKEFLSIISTFSLTVIAWVFFRAESIDHAFSYLNEIFSMSIFTFPKFEGMYNALKIIIIIVFFISIEWFGRKGQYGFDILLNKLNRYFRWLVYLLLILLIYFLGSFSEAVEFIYFQF